MSPITAAFVCALCDPDDPRPASIMCSNNCGRYVCAIHAMPRRGPGSAMVCLACAEAMGLIERPRPATPSEVRPLIDITSEPAPAPQPETPPTTSWKEPVGAAVAVETAASAEPSVTTPEVESKAEPSVAPPLAATAALAAEPIGTTAQPQDSAVLTPKAAPPAPKEPVVIDHVAATNPQGATTRRLLEPEPMPAQKQATSETVVSQRGNTLQVPKVSSGLGKPPQPINGVKPRKAQRAVASASNVDWRLIGMVAGTVALGIIGFALILAALAG